MSVDTNAVHESIKLALDAADAATDVTTEYNRVKRDHRNLEASVKQIHRYTTIIFSVSIGTAILAILLTSILYFRSLSELSVMTNTSKEALVVFAENVENVDGSLSSYEIYYNYPINDGVSVQGGIFSEEVAAADNTQGFVVETFFKF